MGVGSEVMRLDETGGRKGAKTPCSSQCLPFLTMIAMPRRRAKRSMTSFRDIMVWGEAGEVTRLRDPKE